MTTGIAAATSVTSSANHRCPVRLPRGREPIAAPKPTATTSAASATTTRKTIIRIFTPDSVARRFATLRDLHRY